MSSMLQSFVPNPLQHQTEVDKDVVSSNHDLPLGLMSEQRSQQVPQITQTPFDQERYGQSGGTLDIVVLVNLWQLCE
jgi:hypothetical protein